MCAGMFYTFVVTTNSFINYILLSVYLQVSTGNCCDWSQWTPQCHSGNCINGYQTRQRRKCLWWPCNGNLYQYRYCSTQPVCSISGGSWGPWSSYGRCSVTCGGGTQYKYRFCSTGSNCQGSNRMSQRCNTQLCSSGNNIITLYSSL